VLPGQHPVLPRRFLERLLPERPPVPFQRSMCPPPHLPRHPRRRRGAHHAADRAGSDPRRRGAARRGRSKPLAPALQPLRAVTFEPPLPTCGSGGSAFIDPSRPCRPGEARSPIFRTAGLSGSPRPTGGGVCIIRTLPAKRPLVGRGWRCEIVDRAGASPAVLR
jgi:hypothetical protein